MLNHASLPASIPLHVPSAPCWHRLSDEPGSDRYDPAAGPPMTSSSTVGGRTGAAADEAASPAGTDAGAAAVPPAHPASTIATVARITMGALNLGMASPFLEW